MPVPLGWNSGWVLWIELLRPLVQHPPLTSDELYQSEPLESRRSHSLQSVIVLSCNANAAAAAEYYVQSAISNHLSNICKEQNTAKPIDIKPYINRERTYTSNITQSS